VHTKRLAAQNLIEESDRRALIARVVNLQDAEPGAVVNRRELVEPFTGAGNALEELHIHL
jgi:hypothetical protein